MDQVLNGFIADLEMPYFGCFRKPASTSVMLTYPVPPFTTITGMFANALGVPRQIYTEAIRWLQSILLMNLRPLTPPERPSRELAKILKLVGEDRDMRHPTSFPSSPMHKYFLVRPTFRIFVASHDESAAADIVQALRKPARPLYLGQSDDVVTVIVVWQGKVVPCESDRAWALIKGAQETSGERVELLRLPLAFEGERRLLYSPLLTLPSRFPFALPKSEPMWQFEAETVHLFGLGEVHGAASEECSA